MGLGEQFLSRGSSGVCVRDLKQLFVVHSPFSRCVSKESCNAFVVLTLSHLLKVEKVVCNTNMNRTCMT